MAAAALKEAVLRAISELESLPTAQLLDQRYEKFRALGKFTEN